jgi:DNA-binding NarL/FixJ family response regulator
MLRSALRRGDSRILTGNNPIADLLLVSERAVEKHVSNIFSKFGLPVSDADHRRVLAVLAYLEA